MTINEVIAWHRQLPDASARLEMELMLCEVLQKPRSFLYAWPQTALEPSSLKRVQALFERRRRGEPLAHILGRREFWSLALEVNASTLIPRPETELLVEQALQRLPSAPLNGKPRILDLGTGTGAVALALASERPDAEVWALDSESAAVALAQRNAERLKLPWVTIAQSNWFSALPKASRFDLIVSNPPYIAETDAHLNEGDLRFEPRSALVAADDGLADLAYIVEQAAAFMAHRGWLLVEHGWQQAQAVAALFDRHGFSAIFSARDLAGHERVSGGCYIE